MSVTCRMFREGRLVSEPFDPQRIESALQEPDALIWLDVEGPTPESMDMLGREFGFHELALEDCLQPHQRPKIEQYGSYYFLVAYAVSRSERGLVEHELAAFVGRNYLVTVRKQPAFDLAPAVRRSGAHPDLAREGGGYLLYVLLDEIVDGYFDALDQLETGIEAVEDAILEAEMTERGGSQTEIFRRRKELIKFRRRVAPLRDVLDVMQRRLVDVVSLPLEPYYRDVYDHVLRATDFVDSLRDVLSTLLDAHLAMVSNRLNGIMKHLTSYAAIILVPTLIAGIYGMNFRHMPELDWKWGYAYSLGAMAASAMLLYRAFRRRDWL